MRRSDDRAHTDRIYDGPSQSLPLREYRAFEPVELLVRQLDRERVDVLFEVGRASRADNRGGDDVFVE